MIMTNKIDLFSHMVDEAITELNRQGWRDSPQNAVTLAAFGMMVNRVEKKVDKLVKPAWFIGASLFTGIAWLILSKLIGVS